MRIGTRLAWRPDGFEPTIDGTAVGSRIGILLEASESVEGPEALADRVGVNVSTITEIINGTIRAPGRETLVAIANALDVPLKELVDLIDDDALEARGEGFETMPRGE